MANRKVGIWGSYNHGNYGDDVMAIAFAKQFLQFGLQPIVYRFNQKMASSYGFSSTDSIDELVSESDFCVIGGGAWLCSGDFNDDVESDCVQLLRCLNEYNRSLYSLSIGGDGNINPDNLSEARRSLFSSERFLGGTVRLPEDVNLLRALNKSVKFYPDIVLIISDLFDVRKKDFNQKHRAIGVNLNQIQRRTAFYFKLLARAFPSVSVCFLQSHSKGHDLGFEYIDWGEQKNVKLIRYDKPENFIESLSALELIVSFKLHLGVTCMGMGVPFVSVGGSGKTTAFLNSIDLGSCSYDQNLSLFKVVKLFLTARQASRKPVDANIENLKKEAHQHLLFLSSLCKN